MSLRLRAVVLAALGGMAVCAKPSSAGSKACSHTGFYSKKVVPLCEAHFPDSSSKNAWVVQFYHPYVKKVHDSREAVEDLAAAPDQISGAKVGAVDCAQNKEFCAKQGIREAPTTRIMLHGNSRDFSGEHTAEGLRKFVGESVGRFKEMEALLDCEVPGLFNDPKRDATVPLCVDKFPPSLEATPWVVSFYEAGDRNKDKTMKSVMNKLAEKYGNNPPKKVDAKAKTLKIRFGAVSCGDKNDCSKLGVSKSPTVRWYQADGEPADFDSFFDKDELKQWADARLKAMPLAAPAEALKADMAEASGAAAGEAGSGGKLEALKAELAELDEQKAKAVETENFKEAKRIKQKRKELEDQMKKLEL